MILNGYCIGFYHLVNLGFLVFGMRIPILFCFIKVETVMDANIRLILPKWTPYQASWGKKSCSSPKRYSIRVLIHSHFPRKLTGCFPSPQHGWNHGFLGQLGYLQKVRCTVSAAFWACWLQPSLTGVRLAMSCGLTPGRNLPVQPDHHNKVERLVIVFPDVANHGNLTRLWTRRNCSGYFWLVVGTPQDGQTRDSSGCRAWG